MYTYTRKSLKIEKIKQIRTGTYEGPKNTLAVDSACAPLDSALAINAPGAVEPLVQNGMDWR